MLAPQSESHLGITSDLSFKANYHLSVASDLVNLIRPIRHVWIDVHSVTALQNYFQSFPQLFGDDCSHSRSNDCRFLGGDACKRVSEIVLVIESDLSDCDCLRLNGGSSVETAA